MFSKSLVSVADVLSFTQKLTHMLLSITDKKKHNVEKEFVQQECLLAV
jgi:hypothetical protein